MISELFDMFARRLVNEITPLVLKIVKLVNLRKELAFNLGICSSCLPVCSKLT